MEPGMLHRRWTAAVLLVGLVGVFALHRDFGITWDELVQATYGELVLDYFASGLTDRKAVEYANLRFYGPLFEASVALVPRLTGWPVAEVRHFFIGLAALLAVVGLIAFARLFRDPWLPVLAPLVLATLPRFFGHAFNNSKDIPYACFFVWALVAIGRVVARRSLGWSDALLGGAALGLALGVRAGGMLLFGYLALGVVLVLGAGPRGGDWRPRTLALRLLALVAVAWLVMIALWPWAHQSPLLNPLRAFFQAANFSEAYPQLFEGEMIDSDRLPWYYLPKYLLITTPPAVLILLGWGLIESVRRQRAAPREPEAALWLLVQLWLLFPVLYVVAARPNVYNGLRHFLFVLPALALLAGLGATALLAMVRRFVRRGALAVVVVVVLLPGWSLARLHPYQMTYFNFLVGGVGGASARYDTDYWASSYREAALWVNRHKRPDGNTVVLLTANDYARWCFSYYLDPDVELHAIWNDGDPVPPRVDYFVALSRMKHTFAEIPDVYRVERAGAVFAVVRGWITY